MPEILLSGYFIKFPPIQLTSPQKPILRLRKYRRP